MPANREICGDDGKIRSSYELYLFLLRVIHDREPKKLYSGRVVERAERWANCPIRRHLQQQGLLSSFQKAAIQPIQVLRVKPHSIGGDAEKRRCSQELIKYADILRKGIPREWLSNLGECCALLAFELDMFEEGYIKWKHKKEAMLLVGTSKLRRDFDVRVCVEFQLTGV
jgi:hypothetical protein